MERPNAAAAKATGIPLKLLIDRKTKTVVFGEAGKELVDFLFSLLSLPLATIVGLLGNDCVPGSVGQLFDSIEKLDSSFILTESSTPEQVKEELLNPILPSKIDKVSLKKLGWNSPLPARDVMLYACGNCWYNRTRRDSYVYITFEARCSSCSSGPMKALHIVSDVAAESPSHGSSCSYYKCNTCSRLQVASVSGTPCPACPGEMCWGVTILKSIPINRISASTSSDQQRDVAGFVQGVVTYTISDDLTIAPLSTISTISLMQKLVPLRVQDLATLEERTVTVGRNEGLRILKASLHSKKVLTEVFLSEEFGGDNSLDDSLAEITLGMLQLMLFKEK